MRAVLLASLACLALPIAGHAQSVQHGRYIVQQMGMCNDCHTPRNAKGELIAAEALHGAPLGFHPDHPMPWAASAPRIAGLPAKWTLQQTATFLHTGKRPDGSYPLPPMPGYRMDTNDAWSVALYLKTLK
jgi:cytochrome c553